MQWVRLNLLPLLKTHNKVLALIRLAEFERRVSMVEEYVTTLPPSTQEALIGTGCVPDVSTAILMTPTAEAPDSEERLRSTRECLHDSDDVRELVALLETPLFVLALADERDPSREEMLTMLTLLVDGTWEAFSAYASSIEMEGMARLPSVDAETTCAVRLLELKAIMETVRVMVDMESTDSNLLTPIPTPNSAPSTSVLNSLVTIDVFQGGCRQTSGLTHEGGGWVYEDGWVITALHTLRWDGSLFNLGGSDASPVISEVHVNNGDSDYTCGKVVGTDSLRDLAAIKLMDDVDLSPLPTGATPDVDSPVTLLAREGYKGWQEPEVIRIEGRVAGLHQGNGTAYMTAWGMGVSGDSGSPLVDGQGRVIGMLQAGQLGIESPNSPIASSLAGIMPIEEIRKVWERLKAGEHLNMDSQPWFETETWEGGE